MRITIVTGPFFAVPPAPCGAVERVMWDLAKEFAAAGHEVHVVSRDWAGFPSAETRDGVAVRHVRGCRRTGDVRLDLAKDFAYSLRAFRAVPRADLVMTNVFWLPVLLAWLRPRAGCVVVNVNRRPKHQMWLYRRAARLVAVSSAIRDQIVRQSPSLEPITRIIPNPIDDTVFVPPAQQALRDGPFTITYTGRVHPEKGLHLLIDALAILVRDAPRVRLRIVGETRVEAGGGGDAYMDRLRAKAQGLPVEFVAAIYDREKLAALLRESHVYCYPSLAEMGEALPVAPLEAMATGLVPVVSDLPQFRDYVEPGVTGVVFDHRGDEAAVAARLAAALRGLMEDPVRVRAMCEAAGRTAARFGNRSVAQVYLADFESLVRGERS